MSTGDLELMREYAAEGSQAAFAELVARHLDLVYSAARRQVRSPDLAAEVAQTAFLALARHAHRLKADTSLAAWLYVVTRRAALDVLRRESRHQARERAAAELAAMDHRASAWTAIEPLLDEAMEGLAERDRTAILLRYFDNKSLREVGVSLGTSEDAAQKRISRALDQLRTFFAGRGVAVGATALAANLSAGAVQAAPVGLGLTISSATAVAAAAPLIATETFHTLTVTTLQKVILGTTLLAVVGAGFYGTQIVSRQRVEIAALRDQVARVSADNRRLQSDRADDARLLGDAQVALDSARATSATGAGAGALPTSADPAMETELKAVLARVVTLKESFAKNPERQIPEMRYLKDQDWINAASRHKLGTVEDTSAALADVRASAKLNFAELMARALWKYSQANEGQIPTDISLLGPFFNPGVPAEALARYGIVRAGKLADLPAETIVIADLAPKDGLPDGELYISGPRTRPGQGNFMTHSGSYSDVASPIVRAVAGYLKANAGAAPSDSAQLAPFLPTPVDPAKLRGYWKAAGLPGDFHAPRD